MKNMKIIIIALLTCLTMSSCEKWFDVSPKSDVKSDDLFKDENGFWDVLTGVYSIMVTPSAYGRELSFGYLDVMAQYYDKITSQTHNYYKTKGYDYTDTQEETRLKSIWKGHYKAIVNLNVLLEYADKNKNVFASEQHYRVVKGEAFGLRAFLHFDLLRLFGPSPADGLEQQAIPYADTYTNVAQAALPLGSFVNRVTQDLESARIMLANSDWFGPAYQQLYEKRDSTQKERHSRMNYFTVAALQARAYNYIGDKENALKAVHEIINENTKEPMAPLSLTTSASENDRLFKNEILFRLNIEKLEDDISSYFGENAIAYGVSSSATALCFTATKVSNLYQAVSAGDDDYRLKLWFQPTDVSSSWMPAKYKNAKYIPIVRLSEVYLIAAECASGNNGLAYLNKIRAHRGLVALENITDLDAEIAKEYQKEFIAEGQMFFYYKRMNLGRIGVFSNVNLTDKNKVYQLPVPTDELDYGNM